MGRFVKQAVVALCVCCLLVACKANKEDAQKYLEEGKTLLGQGKTEEARVQLQSALQIEPKLAEGYYQLALIDEKKQDWKGMYSHLTDVLRFDPKHVEAHLKLGHFYVAAQQFDKASEQLKLAQQLRPDDAGIIRLRASILFNQGKKAEGLAEVSRGLEKEPNNLATIMLKATMCLTDGKYSDALAVLNQGFQTYPKDVGLQLMKIRVEVKSKNFDAAIDDYRTLISQNPDAQEFQYELAQLLTGIGRTDQAEAILQELVAKQPADLTAKLKLIDLLERRDAGEAENTLKQFIGSQPTEISLQTRLADVYLRQERYSDAQAVLKRIVEEDKSGKEVLSAKVKLARIALVQNDAKTAEALIDQVLAADAGNTGALVLRAGFRLARNESDASISDLRIVLTGDPTNDKALVMLGQAYLQKGAPELAETNLRKALEINPANLAAALPVTIKMMQKNELDKAEEVIQNALKIQPTNPVALQLLVQVRTLRGDWGGAQAAITELGKLPKQLATAHYLSGVMFARQKKFNDAIKQYQQALQDQPDFPQAVQGMAEAYDASKNLAQLIEYLKAFIEKNPTVIPAYNALGLAYGSERKWDDSVKVLQNALKINPKSIASYRILADTYSAQNKPAEVVETYRDGLSKLPDSIPLLMGLAGHFQKVNDIESAIGVYRTLLTINPNDDSAANNLASLLTDYHTGKESLEEALRLSGRFSASSNPSQLDTYAWTVLQLGNKQPALAALKKVVAAAPEVAIFRYHLGVAYYENADKIAAKSELEKALKLGEKQGDFIGMERAKTLLKGLADTSANTQPQ